MKNEEKGIYEQNVMLLHIEANANDLIVGNFNPEVQINGYQGLTVEESEKLTSTLEELIPIIRKGIMRCLTSDTQQDRFNDAEEDLIE